MDNLRLERQNLVGRFDRDSLKPDLAARYVIETFCGQLHLLEIRGCRKRLDLVLLRDCAVPELTLGLNRQLRLAYK